MKDVILKAAVQLSMAPGGLHSYTLAQVAATVSCSPALVQHYYTSQGLRDAVVEHATINDIRTIVGQAIAMGYRPTLCHDSQVTSLLSLL